MTKHSLAIKPMDLAHYIVERQVKLGKPTNTLALQKVLYFVGCEYMKHHECSTSLFDESDSLMKWKFGPTFPEVYDVYSFYGSLNITSIPFTQIFDWDVEAFKEVVESSETIHLDLLNRWIDRYVSLEKYDLVAMALSHRVWRKDQERIENGNYVPYDFEELYEEIMSNEHFFMKHINVFTKQEPLNNPETGNFIRENKKELLYQLRKLNDEVHARSELTETNKKLLEKKQHEAETLLKKIKEAGVSDKQLMLFLLGFKINL